MAAPPHGLFLTRDPVEGVWERSASRNGYAYVEGNPTNWTDPSGEQTCPSHLILVPTGEFGKVLCLTPYEVLVYNDPSLSQEINQQPDNSSDSLPIHISSLLIATRHPKLAALGAVIGICGGYALSVYNMLRRVGTAAGYLDRLNTAYRQLSERVARDKITDKVALEEEQAKQDQDEDLCAATHKEAVKCSELPERYRHGDFWGAFNQVAVDVNVNVNALVGYSRTDGNFKYSPRWKPRGDDAERGPCNMNEKSPPYVGKHWNVWKSQAEFNQRGRGVEPCRAIVMCPCCQVTAGRAELVQRFAVLERLPQ